ncbi:DcaP family trimeric outer membrane transporter [Rubritalea halochordaticola]
MKAVLLIKCVMPCTFFILPSLVSAENVSVEELQKEIAQQRLQIEAQRIQLQHQEEQLKRLEVLANSLDLKTPKEKAVTQPSRSDHIAGSVESSTGKTDSSNSQMKPVELLKTDSEDVLDASPIAGFGRGEEFTDETFLKSVPLFGSDWRFSFGGYSKIDLIYDFSGSGDPRQFLLSEIPVDGVPQDGSYSELQLKETRFNFEVRDTSDENSNNKFYTEFDFFGSDGSYPRLRHAYFQYGNLVAGQTWTTLTELRQLPLFLDFAAGDSLFGGRTVQVRWEQEIDSQFDWAIALEDYSDSGIYNPENLPGTARASFPLLVGRIGYDWDDGLVMLGGSLGENRWDGADSVNNESVLRWNIATGGRVYLTNDHTHYFGFGASYGEGAPRDILTFGNAGTPSAVLNKDGDLENITSWNANTGLHIKWNEKLSSNFGFAYAKLGNNGRLPETSIQSGSAIHGNLIYDWNERTRIGIELMHGEQELNNGRKGSAERLQMSMFYYF